ncbi:MAG: glycosyltransferase family 4 protein, partial [Mycobacteriaceae bacterium]
RCAQVIVASELLAGRFGGRATVVAPGRDLVKAGGKCDLRAGARAAAICVANWLPNKGIVELLDAVVALPAGTLRLHLAGDEHVDPAYRERVIRRLARVRSEVVRHGPCDSAQISRLYSSADLFVLPSRWETYGTVYAEAMTAGLPIIGWRSGNLPHLVDDGHEGVLVPPGDVRALTGALRLVAEDEDTRRRMGTAAAHRARNLPTWEQSARRFFTTLRELHS